MRPIVLSGHSRPLVRVKYNPDGDIIVSTSRDRQILIWSSEDGRLIGSYDGHQAMVWDIDFDPLSRICLSGAADTTAQIWSLDSGTLLRTFNLKASVRSVAIAPSAELALMVVENRSESKSSILVVPLNIDLLLNPSSTSTTTTSSSSSSSGSCSPDEEPLAVIFPGSEMSSVLVARWGPDSNTMYFGHENGLVSSWDARSGGMIACRKVCTNAVYDLQFGPNSTHLIVASWDRSAHILTLNLEIVKSFRTVAPVNSASICPLRNHVILGGGQEAGLVTTTSARAGNFEAHFFHSIMEQEIGRIGGHFGPINSVAVHPDNLSFATGGEDGNIRLHIFDPDYFSFSLDPLDKNSSFPLNSTITPVKTKSKLASAS